MIHQEPETPTTEHRSHDPDLLAVVVQKTIHREGREPRQSISRIDQRFPRCFQTSAREDLGRGRDLPLMGEQTVPVELQPETCRVEDLHRDLSRFLVIQTEGRAAEKKKDRMIIPSMVGEKGRGGLVYVRNWDRLWEQSTVHDGRCRVCEIFTQLFQESVASDMTTVRMQDSSVEIVVVAVLQIGRDQVTGTPV